MEDGLSEAQKTLNDLKQRQTSYIESSKWKNELCDKNLYFLSEPEWTDLLEEEGENYGAHGTLR